VKELIVVACHGNDWVDQCHKSLAEHSPKTDVAIVDTGSGLVSGAYLIDGGYSTGAYLWAYEQRVSYDRFLFIQDSMTALADPMPWFRDLWQGAGAACWGLFPMQWDNHEQAVEVGTRYPHVAPRHGIFGPIFYTDRASLDLLAMAGLFPKRPESRLDAQTAERSWAYAFATLGLPVVGPEWNPGRMQEGFGPFRKTWAARP
jgi:hypothetical protein